VSGAAGVRQRLEPELTTATNSALVSGAISLKRIADVLDSDDGVVAALERIATYMDITNDYMEAVVKRLGRIENELAGIES
jgi:hypothetical protein